MARLRRWELRACARHGHATYAPTEPALAGRLSGTTGVGEVWRCLRCSDFVLGPPHARGPADEAPLVLRGKALQQAVILRLLAAERLLRASRKRSTPYVASPSNTARSNRSAARSRRMTACRSAFPRSTSGASSAGPRACGGPSTKSLQRRQRHTSPTPVVPDSQPAPARSARRWRGRGGHTPAAPSASAWPCRSPAATQTPAVTAAAPDPWAVP